ncbi:MAG: hypothetical protein HZB53_17595 [Chloroflexi bacterium]|nr:hypothetical protein [Chloroflexota bacterium]
MTPMCANCAIIIHWQPTLVHGKSYCCAGCANGGPCECDYDQLPERVTAIRHIRFEISVVGEGETERAEPGGSYKALTTV